MRDELILESVLRLERFYFGRGRERERDRGRED